MASEQFPIIPVEIIISHIIWCDFEVVNKITRTCKKLNELIKAKQDDIIKKYSYEYDMLLVDGYVEVYTMLPNGVRYGKYELYNKDDILTETGEYINDKLEGLYAKCHNRRNSDISTYKYVNGKRNGEMIRKRGSNVISRNNYVNDELHGECVRYYADGSTRIVYNYNMGVLHGPTITYLDDGTESSRVNYIDGVIDGVKFTRDDETRELIEYIVYSKGVIIDCKNISLENGAKIIYTSTENYIIVEHIDPNGNKSLEYSMDRYGNKQGYYRSWNENILVDECFYVNNLPHGVEKIWHVNGVLLRETTFENGKIHGNDIDYFFNGNIYTITPYVNGNREGIEREYDLEGRLMMTTEYKDGYKNGKTLVYRINGNKMYEKVYYRNRLHGLCYKYDINGNITSADQYFLGVLKQV